MSALETELIDKAFCGEWVGIRELPTSLPASQQAAVTVGGAFLRKLLLGLILPRAAAGHNPRMHGIRLQGAIITGEIDLRDCIGIEGEPLPPLLLERCIIHKGFTKKNSVVSKDLKEQEEILSAINASNTWLSRLSLKECRLDGRVDLTDATLGGDLELSDLEPLNASCCCQISLRRCRIDGSVIAQRTRLRILDGQCTEFGLPDYALNLVSAEIQGSVWLQPGFCAHGGVSVRGAHIKGNIWGRAAQFVASSKIAFRAESLQCDGAVALRGNYKTGKPCSITGDLDFESARVGYLDLRGIHVKGSPKKLEADQNLQQPPVDQDFALNLSLSRIRDNVQISHLSAMGETTIKTIVEGQIDARGMTVGGDFDLTGLQLNVPDNWIYSGIIACNVRVGGDLTLNGFTSSINLSSSHVERNLKVICSGVKSAKNSKYGFQAYNITVDNDFDLESISGAFDLELSRIGGALTIHATNLQDLHAKEAEVRGSVRISGRFEPQEKGQSLCFDGGRYLSGLCIGEKQSLKLVQSTITAQSVHGSTNQDENNPILSIENAFIENNFQVTKVEAESNNATPITISLRGLKARVFEHNPSESWGSGIEFKLAGFEYDRIDKHPEIKCNSRETESGANKNIQEEAGLNKTQGQLKPMRPKSWCESIAELLGEPLDKSVGDHIKWLARQKDYFTADGYEAQPYEQLARALRNDGRFEDAKHVTFEKLWLERKTIARGLTRRLLLFMEKCFDYGLFPCKSVMTFFALWILGTIGFSWANSGIDPVLILHSPPVSTFVLPEDKDEDEGEEPSRKHGPPMAMKKTSISDLDVVFERPCDHEVESWWYALDVFVPLLDLKQEDKCSITMRTGGFNWLWRALSNLYEVLGAIVTPIMLLSVSGLLRRYVEE